MGSFQVFTEREIASLRKNGKILRGCLEHTSSQVRPGITTKELDTIAETYIRDHNAEPGFKGYKGFPHTLCTSVNEQCVHGMPSDYPLAEGDIISVDCGVLLDGLYTDACVTVGVGTITPEAQQLLSVSKKALEHAVDTVQQGVHIGDISATIEHVIRAGGFCPVRSLTGHGLGKTLHQFPDIPNEGIAGTGPVLPANTLIAIEPIVSAGSASIRQADDGWTLSIDDGALSAHFEHTLLTTENGCEIIA